MDSFFECVISQEKPLGAATIGQVHGAELLDGTRVGFMVCLIREFFFEKECKGRAQVSVS